MTYKVFESGETLTANDVMTYFMNQVVVQVETESDLVDLLSEHEDVRIAYANDTEKLYAVVNGDWKSLTYDKGGYTQLSNGSLSGASVSITNISGNYTDLVLHITNLVPATDNTYLKMRFNNDTNANRHTDLITTNASGQTFSQTSIFLTPYGMDNTTSSGLIVVTIPRYANTTTFKVTQSAAYVNNAFTTTNVNFGTCHGVYNQTNAITQIDLFMNSGNFTSGEYVLYGLN